VHTWIGPTSSKGRTFRGIFAIASFPHPFLFLIRERDRGPFEKLFSPSISSDSKARPALNSFDVKVVVPLFLPREGFSFRLFSHLRGPGSAPCDFPWVLPFFFFSSRQLGFSRKQGGPGKQFAPSWPSQLARYLAVDLRMVSFATLYFPPCEVGKLLFCPFFLSFLPKRVAVRSQAC